MFWMMLFMTFPVLGLALYFFSAVEGPAYVPGCTRYFCFLPLVNDAFAEVPGSRGREAMIVSTARALNWEGSSGQISWHGEIWQAKAPTGTKVWRGDSVIIDGLAGRTAPVKPDEQRRADRSGVKLRASDESVLGRLRQHISFHCADPRYGAC